MLRDDEVMFGLDKRPILKLFVNDLDLLRFGLREHYDEDMNISRWWGHKLIETPQKIYAFSTGIFQREDYQGTNFFYRGQQMYVKTGVDFTFGKKVTGLEHVLELEDRTEELL